MPTTRQEDAIAALVDTGKLPMATIANHRDATTRTMSIPTGGSEQVLRAIWEALAIAELK